MKTQEQIDSMVRLAAGKRAVEEMVNETGHYQTYSLSDGPLVKVNRLSGDVTGKTESGRKLFVSFVQ